MPLLSFKRALNAHAAQEHRAVYDTLARISQAQPRMLDIWSVTFTASAPRSGGTSLRVWAFLSTGHELVIWSTAFTTVAAPRPHPHQQGTSNFGLNTSLSPGKAGMFKSLLHGKTLLTAARDLVAHVQAWPA